MILFGRKVFFEIVFGVFEDEIEFVLIDFVENVFEAELIGNVLNDVWMRWEFSEDRNLPESGRGDAFIFWFEFDVFDSDGLVGFFVFGLVDNAVSSFAQELSSFVILEIHRRLHITIIIEIKVKKSQIYK